MTAGVGSVSGTKLYIAPAGSTASPDKYVEIEDIASLGDLSQQFAQIAVDSIGDGDTYQIKGQRSFPNFELTLNRNDSDAGQQDLKDASAAAKGTLYPFKIIETDGGSATWLGEVFGYGTSYGGPSNIRQVKTSVSIRPSTLIINFG